MPFDPYRPCRLAEQVALRPEAFGALVYHYGTRRLNLVQSPELARLLECIHLHPSARAAFDACEIDRRRWPSFESALASLAVSEVLVT